MALEKGVPNHRLRFAAGLIAGTALAVGVGYYLLDTARRGQAQTPGERQAMIALRALSDVIDHAGGSGDRVRTAAASWQEANPWIVSIRVLVFDGISLEASTDPTDAGDRAAPRRLSRDEKAFYDRGQRLRTAVETNREEGAPRKDEIEIERFADGSLSIAGPVETDGSVSGMVQIVAKPHVEIVPSNRLVPIACVILPAFVFLLLSLPMGDRRLLLAIGAGALGAAAIAFYGHYSVRVLDRERRAIETSVAASLSEQAARTRQMLLSLGIDQAIDTSSWDGDSYRRSLGLMRGEGAVDEDHLSAELAEAARRIRKAITALALLGLAIAFIVGFGIFSLMIQTVRKQRQAYLYTLPAMVGMLVLVFFPFFYGVALSFTDSTIYNTNKGIVETWVGLRNYGDILGDVNVATKTPTGELVFNYKNFYWTLYMTVLWTVSNVTFGVTVGLILALILNTKGLALRPVYRVLLILPWAMPNYITALIWQGMFHRQFGVINMLIQMCGGTGLSWFDKPSTSFLAMLATNGWLSFPFMMVVSLGALQSIPAELYEAARVDGASRWQQFCAITLPSIKPALIPAIILSVVWTFNMFNIPYLVTGGEPARSTEILITQAYKFAFQEYRYGYAAAYSVVIFGILLVYGVIQNRATRATEAI